MTCTRNGEDLRPKAEAPVPESGGTCDKMRRDLRNKSRISGRGPVAGEKNHHPVSGSWHYLLYSDKMSTFED